MPGTYGTVREALRHLLSADEKNYFRSVTGEDLPPPPEGAGRAPWRTASATTRSAGKSSSRTHHCPIKRSTTAGASASAVAPMAQSIHHADDHRTQVLSILGARGIEAAGNLDVWEYGHPGRSTYTPTPAGGSMKLGSGERPADTRPRAGRAPPGCMPVRLPNGMSLATTAR